MFLRAGNSKTVTDLFGNANGLLPLLDHFDALRSAEEQRHIRRPEQVTRHVTQGPASEIEETASVEGRIESAVRRTRCPAGPAAAGTAAHDRMV